MWFNICDTMILLMLRLHHRRNRKIKGFPCGGGVVCLAENRSFLPTGSVRKWKAGGVELGTFKYTFQIHPSNKLFLLTCADWLKMGEEARAPLCA